MDDDERLIQAVFKKYSNDKNEITCPQFVKIIKKLSGYLPTLKKYTLESVSNAFLYFDKDANGTISYDEFVEWWQCKDRYSYITGDKADELKKVLRIFNKFSTNHRMNTDQFVQAKLHITGETHYNMDEMEKEFDMADTETLGYMTFIEFVDWFSR